MIQIDNYVFSLDLIEKRFKCDISLCHGNCCVEGDSGAPLTDEEVVLLDEIYPRIRDYLAADGIRVIENEGTSIIDSDGDRVTPLIGNRECAYSVYDGKILLCGIEKAFNEGVVAFKKPISCHLFPIRVKSFSGITAVNYQQLGICEPARECGEKEGIPVFRFLKEPIIRAFGKKIFEELLIVEKQLRKE